MLKGKITFCTCNWVRLPCNSAAFSPSNPRMILILWASRLVCKKINTWSLNVRAQSPIRQCDFLDIKQPQRTSPESQNFFFKFFNTTKQLQDTRLHSNYFKHKYTHTYTHTCYLSLVILLLPTSKNLKGLFLIGLYHKVFLNISISAITTDFVNETTTSDSLIAYSWNVSHHYYLLSTPHAASSDF